MQHATECKSHNISGSTAIHIHCICFCFQLVCPTPQKQFCYFRNEAASCIARVALDRDSNDTAAHGAHNVYSMCS